MSSCRSSWWRRWAPCPGPRRRGRQPHPPDGAGADAGPRVLPACPRPTPPLPTWGSSWWRRWSPPSRRGSRLHLALGATLRALGLGHRPRSAARGRCRDPGSTWATSACSWPGASRGQRRRRYDDAVTTQTVLIVGANVLLWGAGAGVRAAGRPRRGGARRSPPILVALAVAAVVNVGGWTVPAALDEPIGLLADACVPVLALGGSVVVLAWDPPRRGRGRSRRRWRRRWRWSRWRWGLGRPPGCGSTPATTWSSPWRWRRS